MIEFPPPVAICTAATANTKPLPSATRIPGVVFLSPEFTVKQNHGSCKSRVNSVKSHVNYPARKQPRITLRTLHCWAGHWLGFA